MDRHGVEVAAERHEGPRRVAGRRRAPSTQTTSESPTRRTAGNRAAQAATSPQSAASSPMGERRAQSAAVRAARSSARARSAAVEGHTWTSKSRSAWLSETFLSVEALRLPTMRAQGMWKVPAGYCFGRTPGMTTERAGTRPL